ncbi:MAG: 5-(carboxyamino)imidazole ribonucleotide mutase [Methanobacteriota archaeon]|jgi:phosphoribosylaminoimidazole carboxylase PurE protein|nr:MAG: 5-(carboxyamino)imidazole ribonucleotide mutase [Euryarchaeota archaeon]
MIGIVVGSDSDLEIMNHCVDKLNELGISNEIVTASAHRNPEKVTEYIKKWEATGYKIIIAAAGMAAALPGVVASQTNLPVIGVPMKSELMGIDSLLSIVQMPKGVPVACMTIGKHGAINAALYAKRILDLIDTDPPYGA